MNENINEIKKKCCLQVDVVTSNKIVRGAHQKKNQAYTHTNLARTHKKNDEQEEKMKKKIIIIWNMTKCAYKWNKSKSLQEIRYYGLKCSDNYLAIIMNNWMAIHVTFHSIISWHTLHFEKEALNNWANTTN